MSDQHQYSKSTLKESMSRLKERRKAFIAKNNNEPNIYLSFFDKKIYFPERRKIREECEKLGHDFISIPYLTNSEYDVCYICDIARRKENHVF